VVWPRNLSGRFALLPNVRLSRGHSKLCGNWKPATGSRAIVRRPCLAVVERWVFWDSDSSLKKCRSLTPRSTGRAGQQFLVGERLVGAPVTLRVRRPEPRPSAIASHGVPMPKPVVNLADVQFDDVEENGFYTSRRALFSQGIGARKLGYNLTELPPGKAQCPFHSHREEEEMFLILEGEGELRFGEQRLKLRQFDVVACPTGGAEVAHQIINTGQMTMRYLSLSTVSDTEVCEYPDSRKIGVFASTSSTSGVRKMFRSEAAVDYYDRESTDPPVGDA